MQVSVHYSISNWLFEEKDRIRLLCLEQEQLCTELMTQIVCKESLILKKFYICFLIVRCFINCKKGILVCFLFTRNFEVKKKNLLSYENYLEHVLRSRL